MYDKMKNKEYHTVGTVLKSNRKGIEIDQTDTTNIQIHDLSWLDTDRVKLVLYAQNHLSTNFARLQIKLNYCLYIIS